MEQNLQQRIVTGHRNLDRLCGIVDSLSQGVEKDKLGDKSTRLLNSIHSLEDGFIELNPYECLFELEKSCNSKNKGTFVCGDCPSYLNIIYQQKIL